MSRKLRKILVFRVNKKLKRAYFIWLTNSTYDWYRFFQHCIVQL